MSGRAVPRIHGLQTGELVAAQRATPPFAALGFIAPAPTLLPPWPNPVGSPRLSITAASSLPNCGAATRADSMEHGGKRERLVCIALGVACSCAADGAAPGQGWLPCCTRCTHLQFHHLICLLLTHLLGPARGGGGRQVKSKTAGSGVVVLHVGIECFVTPLWDRVARSPDQANVLLVARCDAQHARGGQLDQPFGSTILQRYILGREQGLHAGCQVRYGATWHAFPVRGVVRPPGGRCPDHGPHAEAAAPRPPPSLMPPVQRRMRQPLTQRPTQGALALSTMRHNPLAVAPGGLGAAAVAEKVGTAIAATTRAATRARRTLKHSPRSTLRRQRVSLQGTVCKRGCRRKGRAHPPRPTPPTHRRSSRKAAGAARMARCPRPFLEARRLAALRF